METVAYHSLMATLHITEAEAASDFASLIAKVRAGAEVVIESARTPVALVRAPAPPRRTLAECIAMLPEDSTATIDEDFAKDVEAAIESHRETADASAWD
jgi:antitoxin (DNA-binding transcriptional repressor) of toxin-antitoxin stability system